MRLSNSILEHFIEIDYFSNFSGIGTFNFYKTKIKKKIRQSQSFIAKQKIVKEELVQLRHDSHIIDYFYEQINQSTHKYAESRQQIRYTNIDNSTLTHDFV